MTTIVYRDGVLAGDRRISDTSRGLIEGGTTKIFRREMDGALVGVAGSLGVAQRFARWFLSGEQGEMPSLRDKDANATAEAIVIRPNCKVENIYELGTIHIESDYHAIGSGSIAALAAMDMGADARRAVEVACGRDSGSGNGIDELHLDKAIAALSTEREGGLLDGGQQETSPVQSASERDKVMQALRERGVDGGLPPVPVKPIAGCLFVGDLPNDSLLFANDQGAVFAYIHNGYFLVSADEAFRIVKPPITEVRNQAEGDFQSAAAGAGKSPVDAEEDGDFLQASEEAERPSDESQATDQDRVEQADVLLENQPGVSSQAGSTEAPILGGSLAYSPEQMEAMGYASADTVIHAGETLSEFDSSSEPQAANEQTEESDLPALTDQQYQALAKFEDEGTPVLDAEPPSIPRSEIPEGAAVETFTDTGVETVKIGGITRVVEDVADTSQGDAAVFANGILNETKPEPEKPSVMERITGMFGSKKEPADAL